MFLFASLRICNYRAYYQITTVPKRMRANNNFVLSLISVTNECGYLKVLDLLIACVNTKQKTDGDTNRKEGL